MQLNANLFWYAGQYFDDETVTYYLRARYSVTDIIAGLSLALDENLVDGFGKWLSVKMAGHYQDYV